MASRDQPREDTVARLQRELGRELAYAVADIRRTHERLWFGRPVTPMGRGGEGRSEDYQRAKFEDLYGARANALEQPAPAHDMRPELAPRVEEPREQEERRPQGQRADPARAVTRDDLYGREPAGEGRTAAYQQARFEDLYGRRDHAPGQDDTRQPDRSIDR